MIARTLLGALTCAALLTLTASPAHAATDDTRDAAGDQVRLSDQDDTPPRLPVADITRLRTAHSARTVSIETTFARVPRTRYTVIWAIATPADTYDVQNLSYPDGGTTLRLTRDGQTVECHGLTTATRGTRGTITVSVPRSCLGSPRWVRTGAASTAVVDGVQYADDARLRGRIDLFAITLGRRVAVG